MPNRLGNRHKKLGKSAKLLLDICNVERDRVGVLFLDGRYVDTLSPGQYAFWKGPADARVVEVDSRETAADVSGQEIMTADKVTLRVNANVTYRLPLTSLSPFLNQTRLP